VASDCIAWPCLERNQSASLASEVGIVVQALGPNTRALEPGRMRYARKPCTPASALFMRPSGNKERKRRSKAKSRGKKKGRQRSRRNTDRRIESPKRKKNWSTPLQSASPWRRFAVVRCSRQIGRGSVRMNETATLGGTVPFVDGLPVSRRVTAVLDG